MTEALESAGPALEREYLNHNLDNYRRVEKEIRQVFSKHLKRPKIRNRADPLGEFPAEHLVSPPMDELLDSIEQRRPEDIDRLLRRISAEGWRKYLATASRSNARSLFAFLAKAECRRIWGYVPADSLSMAHEPRTILGSRNKCEHIAQTFCAALSAQSVIEPELQDENPDCHLLPPFRGHIQEPHVPVRGAEVTKALVKLYI